MKTYCILYSYLFNTKSSVYLKKKKEKKEKKYKELYVKREQILLDSYSSTSN